VLKNAIDWVYPEWNRKAACFVSYGNAMGARGVQQLRRTAIELQLAPIRTSVHIPVATLWAHYTGGDVDAGLGGARRGDDRRSAVVDHGTARASVS
jgi:NAD(P)H-dependent FMN reductase